MGVYENPKIGPQGLQIRKLTYGVYENFKTGLRGS